MPAQKRQPRLKESCDACSTAKVRCTKETNCSRCQQKGLSCIYSYSRRAGRRTTANAAITKADRRPPSPSSRSSSPLAFGSTPSAPSSLNQSPQRRQPNLDLSPNSDSDSSDVFDMDWPSYNSTIPWDLQNSLLNQYTFSNNPLDTAAPAAVIPTPFDAMDLTTPIPPAPAPNMMTRNFSTDTDLTDMTDLTLSSTTTTSSTACEAVHDELSNLTTFAESMEKKFDAVVRARLQYRDVYSEFGVPVDDIEGTSSSSSNSSSPTVERMLGSGGVAAGKGGVPSPDCNELAFYYSLAELKRRLKWVREDVGSLMGGAPGLVC